MNILAINTSNINSEVLLNISGVVKKIKLTDSQSEHLLPSIDNILTQNNLALENIDYFGVNLGPGSFTGIRIGVSTIKAFMFVEKKQCATLNSFDLVAYNVSDTNFVVMLDSGNKDFYYAKYEGYNLIEAFSGSKEQVLKYAQANNCKVYANDAEREIICDDLVNFVKVADDTLNKIVTNKIANNQLCFMDKLVPIYIKRSQAENSLDENIKNNLKIENATDYKQIINIETECFEHGWNEEMFKQEFACQDRTYLLAKVKDEIVGYIGMSDNGSELNILKVAVLPRFRNLGIGKKLVEQLKQIYNEKNNYTMFLEVDEKNENAKKLYASCGFETVSVRKKYYQNGNDCLVMFLK